MEGFQKTSLPPQVFRKVVHDTIKCACLQKIYFYIIFTQQTESTCYMYSTAFDACVFSTGASLGAQMVKNLPAMQETRVQSPNWKDPL